MSQLDSNAIKEIVKLTTTAFSGENLPHYGMPCCVIAGQCKYRKSGTIHDRTFSFPWSHDHNQY